ncbi:MAG: 30S ribosomal protein S17 [Nanoarchaeota archaeon]|nr:30S ribosomal protein S17 [Nanoarchaeota archaeon]MBU1704083.1 30S ribosomal protein S17 [Nanoarchaeota archaeon]
MIKTISLRGRTFTGVVVSTKMAKTAVVEWARKNYLPKYERYEKRKTTIKAHVPDAIKVVEGDIVKISECRPISKTKNFIIVEKIGQEAGFKERMEALEESKVKEKEEDAISESQGN